MNVSSGGETPANEEAITSNATSCTYGVQKTTALLPEHSIYHRL